MLTKLKKRREDRWSGVVSEVRAVVLGEARGPDGGALLRSPKSHGSTRCFTVKRKKGQSGLNHTGGM